MIAENLKQVLSELPEKVRLVAVSKFHPNSLKLLCIIKMCFICNNCNRGQSGENFIYSFHRHFSVNNNIKVAAVGNAEHCTRCLYTLIKVNCYRTVSFIYLRESSTDAFCIFQQLCICY